MSKGVAIRSNILIYAVYMLSRKALTIFIRNLDKFKVMRDEKSRENGLERISIRSHLYMHVRLHACSDDHACKPHYSNCIAAIIFTIYHIANENNSSIL